MGYMEKNGSNKTKKYYSKKYFFIFSPMNIIPNLVGIVKKKLLEKFRKTVEIKEEKIRGRR